MIFVYIVLSGLIYLPELMFKYVMEIFFLYRWQLNRIFFFAFFNLQKSSPHDSNPMMRTA
jgi:hypothetical protein